MNGIIYSQSLGVERVIYAIWAMDNFQKAIINIYNSLKEGGVAILQFGYEGQLEKLYALVNEVFTEDRFTKHK